MFSMHFQELFKGDLKYSILERLWVRLLSYSSSFRRAPPKLKNTSITELRSQPLQATLTYFQSLPVTLTYSNPFFNKNTHSHPFLDKNDLLPPIFKEKLTHSHPFFKKSKLFPPIFRQQRPTLTHLSRKKAHSYPFFDKSDLLPTFFRHTFTPFSTKTIQSHPIFKKNDHPFFVKDVPLSAIFDKKRRSPTQFQQKQPNPIHFSTNSTHSGPLPLISRQKQRTLTISILFCTDLPPKQLVFTSFSTITDFSSPLPLMH